MCRVCDIDIPTEQYNINYSTCYKCNEENPDKRCLISICYGKIDDINISRIDEAHYLFIHGSDINFDIIKKFRNIKALNLLSVTINNEINDIVYMPYLEEVLVTYIYGADGKGREREVVNALKYLNLKTINVYNEEEGRIL